MLSKMQLTFVALVAAASAFQVPQDQPDGVYIYNGAGNNEHQKVGEIPPLSRVRARAPAAPFAERSGTFYSDKTGCLDGTVTALDYQSATNALSRSCSTTPTISKGAHAYAVSGGAVAYMCNYGNDNPCVSSELQTALSIIAPECPDYRSGYAVSNAWAKSYGYDTTLAPICTNE